MAEEEGSRFPYVFWGSKISLGWRILTTCGISVMPKEIFCRCDEGLRIYSAERPTNSAQDIKAFVELHIEQGCVLESMGNQLAW